MQETNSTLVQSLFLSECVKKIRHSYPKLSMVQIAKKIGIPRSTLCRIESQEVISPSINHAMTIINEAFPNRELASSYLEKSHPEISKKLKKVYNGNYEVPFADTKIEDTFVKRQSYEMMIEITSGEGLCEKRLLDYYGKRSVAIANNLIEKGILINSNGIIQLKDKKINATQKTVQQLLQNLIEGNYDLNQFTNKDNWLSLQYEAVNRNYVMPKIVDILNKANNEIRKLINSDEAKGTDIVWTGLVMDTLQKNKEILQ